MIDLHTRRLALMAAAQTTFAAAIDYRYSDFGQVDYLQLGPTNTLTGDFATHEIRVGIAMRF